MCTGLTGVFRGDGQLYEHGHRKSRALRTPRACADCCLEQFRIEESTRMTCDWEESIHIFYWLGINIFFIEANNCQCII